MKKFIIILAAVATTFQGWGREKVGEEKNSSSSGLAQRGQRIMADCATPKASKELWINNVRTIIYTGGDMWWDLMGTGNAYYYVPAVENRNQGVSSSFAGSIWLGGVDASGQLKVAAMTYRQKGYDFWPGPLDTTNAAADPAVCAQYDNLYSITSAEVENWVNNEEAPLTQSIKDWPGNSTNINHGFHLAPYVDANFDGQYLASTGDPLGARDYPAFDVYHRAEKDPLGFCKTKLYGDFSLFWVFNDRGAPHTETQGYPIGVEVRAQAFGFKTNDEINNMTFYRYEVHNRSSFQLNQTYFTIWNDADLGYYLDDYVGCDVSRGLGYIYNADGFDESLSGTPGYGDFPPAFGCDFFRGPTADPNDGIDNDQDGIIDEPGETIQMSRFTYYNNNIGAFPPQTTNPDISTHYYGFMTGFWKDGSPFTQGGNAYGGNTAATFVYDGDPVTNTGWTERSAGNPPGDRRFLQSAGPFTLKPGSVNDIIFGMPWAQSSNKGDNMGSLKLLYAADDKAQKLFDNCFKLLDGPEGPDMTIQEMNNELIIYLSNEKGKSNNYTQYNNDYKDIDINISIPPSSGVTLTPAQEDEKKTYKFEGYKVYQVKDDQVTANDLEDVTKSRLVFQCDVANDVTDLINYEQDNTLGGIFVAKQKVKNAANKGITSTFKVTEDLFSIGENKKLVNNKTYYFIAVAYAFNEYTKYVPDVAHSTSTEEGNSLGQKKPYLEGRLSKRAAGTPHNTDSEKGGTLIQAAYGFGPKITRVEGQGNGGNKLALTKESEDAIVKDFFVEKITYENAQGPVSIKVVDPLNVKNSNFSLRLVNSRVDASAPTTSVNAMISSTAANTYTGTIAAINANLTSWELVDLVANAADPTQGKYYPNEIRSDADSLYQAIRVGNEVYFQDLGISVNVTQVADPAESVNAFTNYALLGGDYAPPAGAFLGASVSYVNGTSNWLNPVKDVDGDNPLNWILSGSTNDGTNDSYRTPDAYYAKRATSQGDAFVFYDKDKQFGEILESTWAPYSLCASVYTVSGTRIFCGPAFTGAAWFNDKRLSPAQSIQSSPSILSGGGGTELRKLSSVLVVLTRDKSKWTRSVVLEMQEKSELSEGNAVFFSPRKHASVDKNGLSAETGSGADTVNQNAPNFISETGMGWFPGYAINLETGERLNIAFGEDSYQRENNGNDMIWNPTSKLHSPYAYAMGGKHFVYVFAGNTISTKFPSSGTTSAWLTALAGKDARVGRYDHGKRLMDMMKNFFTPSVFSSNFGSGVAVAPIKAIERDIMWVSIPLPATGSEFATPDLMPSDVRFQINVSKPYRHGYSGIATLPAGYQALGDINRMVAVNNPSLLTTHINTVNPENGNFPLYTFSTSDIATLFGDAEKAKNALDLIRIVPNPYYGSSAYEASRTDNKVRITNLPNRCTIKIFTMNGTLVRTITRDVSGQEDGYRTTSGIKQSQLTPYAEWDLKNDKNISVAGGLYIFHIDAPGVGEKVLKWFGIMRPLDVQSY
ncbi:MAG: hypothetical protein KF900_05885 [Bacteroidetes bacterium]|nr:hypothetical protein [Bacteroidota bacterium]